MISPFPQWPYITLSFSGLSFNPFIFFAPIASTAMGRSALA
jgi:hypothetical protein